MKINLNHFIDMLNDKSYEFKRMKNLDYVSNILEYSVSKDISEIEVESDKDLILAVENIMYSRLIDRNLEHLQSEENIKELTDIVIDELKHNFDYYTTTLMYNKYDMYKYWSPYGKLDSQYAEVKDHGSWHECPKCKLKPLVWIFNNGAQTRCGCDSLSIRAESFSSVYTRTGKIYYENSQSSMCEDELKYNWNHYCETGEDLFAKLKESNSEVY